MNYEAWAEWYDVVYATEGPVEVNFYVDLARQSHGPVLEIGVGTGRIAIPTARAGIDVVGVDIASAMLDTARRKSAKARVRQGRLELVQADMRKFDLGRKFRLVTIPARTLLLADDIESQRATLVNAKRHLARGGRLAFNVFVPDPHLLAPDSDRTPFFWEEVVNPANGRRCILWALNRFDTVRQTNDGLQIIEELDERNEVVRKVYLDVRIRYLHPTEVRLLVESCELKLVDVFGGFDRVPFDEHSPEMICICRAA
ncbi:MAG: class I SAM-dependent methyltransferase [Chloroflexi bacterium]|nr:class I SAM-dependent methyltransferase [Chloroflexota bacterium]